MGDKSHRSNRSVKKSVIMSQRSTIGRTRASAKSSNTTTGSSASQCHEVMSTTQKGHKRGAFRNMMMKMGTKMGNVEQSTFPAHVVDFFNEVEAYKAAVEEVALRICNIIQQTPGYIKQDEPPGEMNFEYKGGGNPYELLGRTLEVVKGRKVFENEPQLTKLIVVSKELGVLHRDYQHRSRKMMHTIRTFINVTSGELMDERKSLNASRQEMDFAKHELKNAKDQATADVRQKTFKNAQNAYQAQLQKLQSTIDSFPALKDTHVAEVTEFLDWYKKYHEQCQPVYSKVKLKGGKPAGASHKEVGSVRRKKK